MITVSDCSALAILKYEARKHGCQLADSIAYSRYCVTTKSYLFYCLSNPPKYLFKLSFFPLVWRLGESATWNKQHRSRL